MKVGSLVEFTGLRPHDNVPMGCKLPPLKTPLTVRAFTTMGGYVGVYFEEVCMGFFCGVEICVYIELVREIEFPPSLTEEIEECLTREPVLI